MEEYEVLDLSVIVFDSNDVITDSEEGSIVTPWA